MNKRKVAIVVFEGAEVLDFSGPFEVFSVTSELAGHTLFEVGLVAAETDPLRSVNGMIVQPNASFRQLPDPDVLVIAGGQGSRVAMHDQQLLDWVATAASGAEIVMSVCSGALILGRLGLLDGLEVTTHHQALDELRAVAPAAHVLAGKRFVDTGKIITTGGISAGIDGSFHVVSRLLGDRLAQATADYMEYDWTPTR